MLAFATESVLTKNNQYCVGYQKWYEENEKMPWIGPMDTVIIEYYLCRENLLVLSSYHKLCSPLSWMISYVSCRCGKGSSMLGLTIGSFEHPSPKIHSTTDRAQGSKYEPDWFSNQKGMALG